MTYPRSHTVVPGVTGIYHCISRCVRRAWLCGDDALTGRSFNHRKSWIENRLIELADVFAVELWGYSVMSNHYHAVIEVVPERATGWSDADVAERWLRLCKAPDAATRRCLVAAILENASRLEVLRQRLGDLSWFMRYVNEPLARWANKEDECTGRFWEGRFRCEALLDDKAVLAAMAYVDLNPQRAGLAKDPETATHTSLARRLKSSGSLHDGMGRLERFGMTPASYLELVRYMARIGPRDVPVLDAGEPIGGDVENWHARMKALCRRQRAYGSVAALRSFAKSSGRRWIKGVSLAPGS